MTKFVEKRKEARKITKPIVVFYHADCTDGFSAAWAAWKKFGAKADYVPYQHGDPVPEVKGKEIYTIDLTFPEPITRQLLKDNQRLTSIDHHISSKAVTELTQQYSYALNHSGATLAWKYFHPDKPMPEMLLLVEDNDIGRFTYPGHNEFYAYFDLLDFDFKVWDKLIRDFEVAKTHKRMLAAGTLLLRYEDKILDRHIAHGVPLVEFEGHKVFADNAMGAFRSQIGNKLAKLQPPFAIVWWQNKNGAVKVSMRGSRSGKVDLSKIAKKYGGGGHHGAAAFSVKSLQDIPWKIIKTK